MKIQAWFILSLVLIASVLFPTISFAQIQLDEKVVQAVQQSKVPVLAEYMNKGGDINLTTKSGNSVLMLASKIGDKQVIDYVLAQYPDLNAQNKAGATALMIAAKYGQLHIIENLLEMGANPKIKNNNGFSAANFAFAFDHQKIYRKLVEAERKFS